MTTVNDIKRTYRNAKRTPYRITASMLSDDYQVNLWLRELQRLETEIRRYALAHGVTLTA